MKTHIYILIIASLLLASCGSKKDTVKKFYLIELQESAYEKDPTSSPLANAFCEITDVKIAPPFASRQIAIRDESHQIRYFNNHEWADRPQLIIQHIILNYIETEKIFNRVADRFWKVVPEYQIQTAIHNLEIKHQGRDFVAYLNIEFMLNDIVNNQTVVLHKARREEVLEGRNLNLMALSISNFLEEELGHFSEKIRTTFQEQ